MKLNREKVYNCLREKGIEYLYHANTVTTSLAFIKDGGLLSRGAVEYRGYPQTPQTSDEIDKRYNIWDDIFLDNNDLHQKFNRQNHYGPVLFKFSVDVLTYENLPDIWVTYDNPTRWFDTQTDSDRYFSSIEELDRDYQPQTHEQMITLRHTTDPLPFFPYLEEIILDDPRISNFFEEAKSLLSEAMLNSSYNYSEVPIKTRQHTRHCYCTNNYLSEKTRDELNMLFKHWND